MSDKNINLLSEVLNNYWSLSERQNHIKILQKNKNFLPGALQRLMDRGLDNEVAGLLASLSSTAPGVLSAIPPRQISDFFEHLIAVQNMSAIRLTLISIRDHDSLLAGIEPKAMGAALELCFEDPYPDNFPVVFPVIANSKRLSLAINPDIAMQGLARHVGEGRIYHVMELLNTLDRHREFIKDIPVHLGNGVATLLARNDGAGFASLLTELGKKRPRLLTQLLLYITPEMVEGGLTAVMTKPNTAFRLAEYLAATRHDLKLQSNFAAIIEDGLKKQIMGKRIGDIADTLQVLESLPAHYARAKAITVQHGVFVMPDSIGGPVRSVKEARELALKIKGKVRFYRAGIILGEEAVEAYISYTGTKDEKSDQGIFKDWAIAEKEDKKEPRREYVPVIIKLLEEAIENPAVPEKRKAVAQQAVNQACEQMKL